MAVSNRTRTIRNRARSGSKSFSSSVADFAKQTNQDIGSATLTAVKELQRDIILKTPVDTGAARGSWTVSIGALPRRYNSENDKTGQSTIAKNLTRLTKLKSGESVYLASNKVYMPLLEYGWSKQSPAGMVRIAIRKWQRYMKNAVRNVSGKAGSFRAFR